MSESPQQDSPHTPDEVPPTDPPEPKRVGDEEEINLLSKEDDPKDE